MDVDQNAQLNLATNLPGAVGNSFTNGCFQNGAQFNLWINNVAATNAAEGPYVITIDPAATWCSIDISGTVDSVGFSITTGATLPQLQVNRICIEKPGTYIVNYYQFWAAYDCTYNFGSSSLSDQDPCINVNQLPSCFAQGAQFNLWVNAEAAIQAYMAPQTFIVNGDSQWATVTLGGTVDSITYSLVYQDQFPFYYTSGVAVCNQGFFDVSNYMLYYSENCQYDFNSTADDVNLASLSQSSTSCFGPGSTFNVWVSPTAATSNSMAPYNFVYDPNAYPVVIVASGTVDNVAWGFVEPATVDTTNNWICEPSNYPTSALNATGSGLTMNIAAGSVLASPGWLTVPYTTAYPQCSNTQALQYLTGITDIEPNPTSCNADLIEWLILNLLTAIPIGE